MTEEIRQKGRQGFASMHPDRVKEIASLGGKTAHATGKAYKWTSEQAASAGRKGGSVSRRKYRSNPLPQVHTEEQLERIRFAMDAYNRHFGTEEGE